MSRSVELNTSLVKRALGTFYMSDPNKKMIIPEQGSVSPSRASRITDSNQTEENNQNKRLYKSKNQAKQKPAMSATKSNLDADSVNDANKPLTRARARILASQDSQSNNENHPLVTNEYELLPTHAPAPSGSRLTIKRLKD